MNFAIVRYLSCGLALASLACRASRDAAQTDPAVIAARDSVQSDSVVIAAVQPHLDEFRLRIGRFASPFGDCMSPAPKVFPVCQHDKNRLLLLTPGPANAHGAGDRVLGIAYVPDSTDQSHIGSSYVGHLGRRLGHGWYQVYAIRGLD